MKLRVAIFIPLQFMAMVVWGQNALYYFSYQIDSILKADSNNYKYQTASWNYAFIGNYKMALEIKDRQFPNAKPSKPSQEQIDFFKKYQPISAKEEILKEAAKHKILIINEAHHISLHRAFLKSLLKDLHQLGYSFIGFEALNYEDSFLNQRKYPIINSGTYIKDPCFGNLIREAIENKYTVFPYEQMYNDPVQVALGREKAEATNIKKVMDKNPNAKFIIYCGYDHAVEDTLKNFMGLPTAGQLKKMTGEDPFTIDQTVLTEYYLVGNRYRKLINETYDALFIDSTFNYFSKASFPKAIDCNLYHPNTEYTQNRPNWLISDKTKFVALQDKITIDYPYIIKIYFAGEDLNTAVPIDVVEIKSAEDKTASVVFKKKKQIAVVVNSKGERQVLRVGR